MEMFGFEVMSAFLLLMMIFIISGCWIVVRWLFKPTPSDTLKQYEESVSAPDQSAPKEPERPASSLNDDDEIRDRSHD
jgi:hypothetical protein